MAHASKPAVTEATHAPAHGHAEHHGSYWPVVITIGTTIFLLGTLKPILAVVGGLIMAVSLYGWIREDVKELSGKPYGAGHSEYLYGTLVLIASEVVIFGILFTFYFWSRSHTEGFVPEAILAMDMVPIYVNTALLLASGATVHTAQVFLKKGNMTQFRIWLGLTILLGAAFVGGQILEYSHLMHEGLTATSSVYGTSFYSLTGVHGLHVVAGVVVLAIIWGLSFTGFITKERASGVEGAFIYWHFVDLVWILVVSIVYLRLI